MSLCILRESGSLVESGRLPTRRKSGSGSSCCSIAVLFSVHTAFQNSWILPHSQKQSGSSTYSTFGTGRRGSHCILTVDILG